MPSSMGFPFFAHGYPIVPAAFVERRSFPLLGCLGIFVKVSWPHVWGSLFVFSSLLLAFLSSFALGPLGLDRSCFTVNLELRAACLSNFALFGDLNGVAFVRRVFTALNTRVNPVIVMITKAAYQTSKSCDWGQ